ncbi:hypothetical protein [Candidatus Methylobacter favarea]|uniref:hypothetical protein n=1 Tax=Candidatus Methylobacter favarea TaxID=2707345 RepID=UPI00157CE804|nr:hypothetical protein [Candidatus Methylobacter favarea]
MIPFVSPVSSAATSDNRADLLPDKKKTSIGMAHNLRARFLHFDTAQITQIKDKMTTALLDRIIPHFSILTTDSNFYRFRQLKRLLQQ